MATMAPPTPRIVDDRRFFLIMAIVMAATIAAGFSVQLAMGRSSFGAPLYVHFHAVVFFGWVALYLLQNVLVANGAVALHRRLGWLAVVWVPLLVVVGTFTTVEMARRAAVPFFFTPAYFLLMNPLTVLVFAALAGAAIVLRRRTDWHRRLLYCGMAILTGPAFGRLLPVPFLIPFVGLSVFAAVMLFPLIGVASDLRRRGSVHPAWWWGIGAIVAMQCAIELVGNSAAMLPVYAWATAGSPGAGVAPLAYPPSPLP
ncbi:hypothetical protein ACG3SL_13695 [Sphingomonas sp. CJ20]